MQITLLLVFVYIYVSVSVLIFDLVYTLRRRHLERTLPEQVHTLEVLLERYYLRTKRGETIEPQSIQSFFRSLRNINRLSALDVILEEEVKKPAFVHLIGQNIPAIYDLFLYYQKRSDAEQAFFSHLLAKLPLTAGEDKALLRSLGEEQVNLVTSPSIYLSENALKALMSFGETEHITQAMMQMNRHPRQLREKLLTDHLLCFHGSHETLSTALWNQFPQLCTPLQVVFVNYLRLLPKKEMDQQAFWPVLLTRLESQKEAKELQLAIIRYFSKYAYEPAHPIFMSFLTPETAQLKWEYAAVAATALASYPGEDTQRALMEAVRSTNWYVRYNASESLVRFGVDEETLIDHSPDRFAREMFRFRLQVHHLKQREVVRL